MGLKRTFFDQVQVSPALQKEADRAVSDRHEAIALVLDLGRALHRFGTSADRCEGALSRVTGTLGLEGRFFCTPTSLFAAFGPFPSAQTHLLRLEPGEVDLGKLCSVDRIMERVLRRKLTPRSARHQVRCLTESPPRTPAAVMVAAFAGASATAAWFFGGELRATLGAGAAGLVVGVLAILAARRESLARVFELVAAFGASLLAVVAERRGWIPDASWMILGSLIVLLPGLSITVAMQELATRHLVAGTARLLGAAAVVLTIGLGVALGRSVGGLLPEVAAPGAVHLGAWADALCLALSPLTFAVLFRAPPRHFALIWLAAVSGHLATRTAAPWLGAELATFLGAFLVAAGSHVVRRRLGVPSMVTLLPGIMLLVPGSLGLRSFHALFDQDVLAGVQSAFQMVVIASALVAGILIAGVAVPPRRPL